MLSRQRKYGRAVGPLGSRHGCVAGPLKGSSSPRWQGVVPKNIFFCQIFCSVIFISWKESMFFIILGRLAFALLMCWEGVGVNVYTQSCSAGGEQQVTQRYFIMYT